MLLAIGTFIAGRQHLRAALCTGIDYSAGVHKPVKSHRWPNFDMHILLPAYLHVLAYPHIAGTTHESQQSLLA